MAKNIDLANTQENAKNISDMVEADTAMSAWNVRDKAKKMKNSTVSIAQKIPEIKSCQRWLFREH
jgi:hypothetical protein